MKASWPGAVLTRIPAEFLIGKKGDSSLQTRSYAGDNTNDFFVDSCGDRSGEGDRVLDDVSFHSI
jgi:hypothetical protein